MDFNANRAFAIAHRVVNMEVCAIAKLNDIFDQIFIDICTEIINCNGKIILSGMGKSGHIARKIAATMSSLGISSFFVHPGEAMHGDLGMISEHDLVIAISYSGESDEIIKIIPNIKMIGAKLIGLTSNPNSTLALKSDLTQCFPSMKEACHLGLAPTTSTTSALVYGDVLAVTVSELSGFGKNDFGLFHPSGSLGKKLTIRAIDLMNPIQAENMLKEKSNLASAILQLAKLETEILTVGDKDRKLIGIVTNGDIERAVLNKEDIYQTTIKSIINRYPVYIDSDTLAIDALNILLHHKIQSLPIVHDERVIGILCRNKILEKGIYV